MPGFYAAGEYDVAGTIVGVVDRGEILDGSRVAAGDIVVGLPSWACRPTDTRWRARSSSKRWG
jgi:phosphoribosylaminoimidazole (AIR) synthetase